LADATRDASMASPQSCQAPAFFVTWLVLADVTVIVDSLGFTT
jgi:hypothetical protein